MLDGKSYGVFVDRFTGWPGIFKGDTGEDVTNFLARVSESYGVPVRGRPILFNRLFLTDTDTDLFSITDTDI